MKNILLMVPRLNIGGAETYTAMVAENLQKRGYFVHIASGGGLLANKLAQKGIKNSWLPMRFSTDISAYLLKHIVKKYNIDLIHANSAAAGITAMKYKQRYKNIPVVYTAHGKFGNLKKENILKDCDKIIYVSKFIQEDSLNRAKFPQNNNCVIYIGINKNKFNIKKPLKITRNQLNLKENDFVMAITARIKNLRNKGHQDLLDMMHKYPDAKKWHLLVIGKGKGIPKLKALIKKYNLENNVHCIGHVDNVEDFVRLSNVVVLPSDFETFGLALAEGMAMGKPGVAYNVGGIPEIINDKKNGFLVKYKDIDDLYDKLNTLAKDQQLCQTLGENAHKYIEEHFSCNEMITKTEQVYKELLSEYNHA